MKAIVRYPFLLARASDISFQIIVPPHIFPVRRQIRNVGRAVPIFLMGCHIPDDKFPVIPLTLIIIKIKIKRCIYSVTGQ